MDKKCTNCGIVYPATLEYFHKERNGLRGDCKECRNKVSRRWHQDNKTERLVYFKKWREDNKGYMNQWRKDNPDKHVAIDSKRRASKKDVKFEKFSRQDVLDMWGTVCHICLDAIELDDWHMDHVHPLSKGGEHSLNNVKPSHPTCNMSKGASII